MLNMRGCGFFEITRMFIRAARFHMWRSCRSSVVCGALSIVVDVEIRKGKEAINTCIASSALSRHTMRCSSLSGPSTTIRRSGVHTKRHTKLLHHYRHEVILHTWTNNHLVVNSDSVRRQFECIESSSCLRPCLLRSTANRCDTPNTT